MSPSNPSGLVSCCPIISFCVVFGCPGPSADGGEKVFAVAHCGCAKSTGAVIVEVILCRGRTPSWAGLEVSLALNGNGSGGVAVKWHRAVQQLNPAAVPALSGRSTESRHVLPQSTCMSSMCNQGSVVQRREVPSRPAVTQKLKSSCAWAFPFLCVQMSCVFLSGTSLKGRSTLPQAEQKEHLEFSPS